MATYRITVKSWDRHYGEGHVVASSKIEGRRTTKRDEEAVTKLTELIAKHPPQGREAVAWVEVTEPRRGPTTLGKYDGATGRWIADPRFTTESNHPMMANARSERSKLESLVWKHKHPDFKGKYEGDSEKYILMHKGSSGTITVPLSELSDEELISQLPRRIREERVSQTPRSDPPEPKFTVGDEVVDIEIPERRGEVVVVGAYDAFIGGYRYKVQQPGGPRQYWHETNMRLAAHTPNARRAPADEVAARELCLYIENDYPLVGAPNSQGKAIEKNLLAKVRNGSFDRVKSEIAWGHLMETSAKKYAKEYADARDWSTMFTPATRALAAVYFADKFCEEHTQTPNASRRSGPEGKIEKAMLALTGGERRKRVWLSDLRDEISLSHSEIDTTLLTMQRDGLVVLMRADNPAELTPDRRRASISIAGNPRHIVYLE